MACRERTEVSNRSLRRRYCRFRPMDSDLYPTSMSLFQRNRSRAATDQNFVQADCIFVVADAGAEPSLGEHEKLLVGMKTTARKELVLLHAERFVQPGSTRDWLRVRTSFIFSIRVPFLMSSSSPESPLGSRSSPCRNDWSYS